MHSFTVANYPGRLSVGVVTALAALLCGCGSGGGVASKPLPPAPASLRLASAAFAPGGAIPRAFTCDGQDRSPPLRIGGVPARARQLALSLDDPDAPSGDFTHWLLYGVRARTSAIPAGGAPPGAVQGRNSFGKDAYSGPCPPKGDKPHHYRFVLYALPSKLGLKPGASVDEFRAKVSAAPPISEGTFTGTYSR